MAMKISIPLAIVALTAQILFMSKASTVHAACSSAAQTYGIVTGSFTVSDTGTYRVWSRLIRNTTNTSADSYILEIDNTYCGIVVGDSSLPMSAWTWVDSRDGNPTSKINVNLTSGTHSYKLYGREAGVGVDKLIFTKDTTCVPIGIGDNCTVTPDTTPPTVSITSPTAGQTVSGIATIAAAASDNIGISSVSFYLDDSTTPFSTDTTSPYSAQLSTTPISNGSHTISAKATDTAGLTKLSSLVSVNVANITPDTTPPTVSITSPTAGQTVSGTATITAAASDNIGVTKVEVYINDLLMGADTSSPYTFSWNTNGYSNGNQTIRATAYDAAGNKNSSTNVTMNVNNLVQAFSPGDVNKSGIVDVFDLSIILTNWNTTPATWGQGDVSGDSIVNVFDLSVVLTNWKR